MPNRLAGAASPYLRQHAENPVDWYPWGEEAFLRARLENKPIFLSVGYATCHWCHVMAHESFEDEAVAAFLNAHFISIKLDREERPDVDEVYMTAVQLLSGRGGWPMTVFMTPDKKPFFAGTYFPKDDRGQYPGLMTLLRQIAHGWAMNAKEFLGAADEMARALRQVRERRPPQTFTPLSGELLSRGIAALIQDFDREYGGFGEAPKFPPHTALEFLITLSAAQLEGEEAKEIQTAALGITLTTLDAMASGGVRDHIGGGFHRYSTDRIWLLPHFEKMLYDNALMLTNYALAGHRTRNLAPDRSERYLRVGAEIVSWMEREMLSPEGFLYSALDADSEGEEGRFYTWTVAEIEAILGERAANFLADYGFLPEGNFEDEATQARTGRNVTYSLTGEEGYVSERATLLEARNQRVRPSLDDKALAASNGLAIIGLALFGAIPLAQKVAEAWVALGDLPHQVVAGQPSGDAFLDDYAAMALGLLTLSDAVDEAAGKRYRAVAAKWLKRAIELFEDPAGGFYGTADAHENLFGRTKPATDTPTPSANALMARALLRAGDLARAEATVEALKGWMEAAPAATEALLLATLEVLEAKPEPEEATPAAEAEAAAPAAPVGPPTVRVDVPRRELAVGETGEVVIEVPEGWHINSAKPPARWLIPTAVEIQPIRAEVAYPEGETYEGRVVIPFTPQAKGEFELVVRFQACTDRECLEPVERRFDAIAR